MFAPAFGLTVRVGGAWVRWFAVAAMLTWPTAAASQRPVRVQVTPAVGLDARAYDHADALIRAGMIRTGIVGQRPYSRLEMARLALEARARLASSEPHDAVWTRLDRAARALEHEFTNEVQLLNGTPPVAHASVEGASLGGEVLDARGRRIEDVGLGGIDARVNPLTENRGGRQSGSRSSAWAEGAGYGSAGRHLAATAQAQVLARGGAGDPTAPTLALQRLSGSVGAWNIVLEAGRQPVLYGQGMAGGPFSTRNAPALDMVRIGNDIPARLPGALRRLGPARGALFIADLGPDRVIPHAKLVGWKVSFLPSHRIEVGMSLLSQQGGRGAPAAAWHERVIDVITIVDVLLLQDRDLTFSNKLAGFDVRWRATHAEAYVDAMLDDFDLRRIASSLWQDAGYVAGFVVPGLGPAGATRLEAEYQHTGLRYYQHGQFGSGVTAGGHIIGLALGPRADAVQARLVLDGAGSSSLAMVAAAERRSDDRYETAFGADDAGFRFAKIEDRPEEFRVRLMASAMRAAGAGRMQLEMGAERVVRWNFEPGTTRTNLVARLVFVAGFD